MKSIFNKLLAFLALAALIGCSAGASRTNETQVPETAETAEASGDFSIYAFKIGKADAFVMQTENGTVLLDCGETDDAEEILEYLDKNNITYIDYLIISHFDRDHVGGAADIINAVQIGAVLSTDDTESSDEYNAFIQALKDNGLKQTIVDGTYTFTLDDVSFAVLAPFTDDYNSDPDNNKSLVVSIYHGNNSFFFTGDAMDERIEELLTYGNIEHTLLKVPHHGVYSDRLPDLIEAVSPSYAIITSSDKNPEDDETLELLDNIGAETYTTRNGDISITSDGESITIKQK